MYSLRLKGTSHVPRLCRRSRRSPRGHRRRVFSTAVHLSSSFFLESPRIRAVTNWRKSLIFLFELALRFSLTPATMLSFANSLKTRQRRKQVLAKHTYLTLYLPLVMKVPVINDLVLSGANLSIFWPSRENASVYLSNHQAWYNC